MLYGMLHHSLGLCARKAAVLSFMDGSSAGLKIRGISDKFHFEARL